MQYRRGRRMDGTGARVIRWPHGSGKLSRDLRFAAQDSKGMQTDNRFLDDLAKVASGALGSIGGVKHEVEMRLQQQLERLLGRMNLVSRDEFEAMKAVAQAAREAQIRLEARLLALEARLAGASASPVAPTAQESDSEPR
jgi:BMFP domain-containing protein YqiC